MISVSTALRAALDAVANQPLDVFELYLDSGTLYFSTEDITWNGVHYLPYVNGRSAIGRYDGGQFDSVSVNLANVDLTIAQRLLAEEIEGRKLIIRKIDRTVTDDSLVLFNGLMERVAKIDEQTASITATQIVGSIDFECPSRLFTPYCPWPFKGVECGYSGAQSSCDKSWARCHALANTNNYGGFRFIPHSGSYSYQQMQTERFMLFFTRKKKSTVIANFSSADDTPYDVPIPIILGRTQLAAIDIQHEDVGSQTKVLAAFGIGTIKRYIYIRCNGKLVGDWDQHLGQLGGTATQLVDPRFPDSYPYHMLAYIGCTIGSDPAVVDSAPVVDAVVQGLQVSWFNTDGSLNSFGWTDNPIWLTRHFMALPLQQGGMGIPDDWFDYSVLVDSAAYCDQTITDNTNSQVIYLPTSMPDGMSAGWDYQRFRSTGCAADPAVDGPYNTFTPGVDDDTSTAPTPVTTKRFTMNLALAQAEAAVDILFKKLLPSFRGYITFSKTGKIQLRVERPVANTTLTAARAAGVTSFAVAGTAFSAGDRILVGALSAAAEVLTVASHVGTTLTTTSASIRAHASADTVHRIDAAFDDSTIVGDFAYPLADRQPSINRISVKYVDAPAGFESRELQINDYEHQTKVHKINSEDFDGSAIDSYFQAWRIGQWRRAKLRDLGKFCSFTADIKASTLEIGDVIAVSASETGLQCVPFRVIEISYLENDEVTIVGQLYSLSIYSDSAPQATVTVPSVFSSAGLPTNDAVATPLDYGAVGDGVTDDTAAVQACAGANAAWEVPAGYTFLVSGLSIAGKANLTLTGSGTIRLKAPTGSYASGFALVGIGACAGVTIDGPTFDYANRSTTSNNGNAITLWNNTGVVKIQNISAMNAPAFGIWNGNDGTSSLAEINVLNCRFAGCPTGTNLDFASSTPCPVVRISGVSAPGLTLGIVVNHASRVLVSDCDVHGCTTGMAFNVDDSVNITGCNFFGCATPYSQYLVGALTTYNCIGAADVRVALPAPPNPTSITGSVSLDSASFTLLATVAHAAALGSAKSLSVEVRYYLDAACTNPDSEWIPVGTLTSLSTTALEYGPFPAPSYAAWAVIRAKYLNSEGTSSPSPVSTAALAISPKAVAVASAAVAPTAVTLSITSKADTFQVLIGWTPAGSIGGTVVYERQIRFFTDAACTVADSPWITTGESPVGEVSAADGPFTRAIYPTWIKAQVRAKNVLDQTSAWTACATIVAIAVMASPPAATGNTSSVEIDTTGVKLKGVPAFRFHLACSAPADATLVAGYTAQVRYYSDSGATTAVSNWIELGDLDATTRALDTDWWPLPEVVTYAVVAIRAFNQDGVPGPWLNSSVLTVSASSGIDLAKAKAASLPAAAFAATIEPVELVSSVPSSQSGHARTLFNTTDRLLYVWDSTLGAYKKSVNSTDVKSVLSIDQLVAGQIAAGAIGTSQMATTELLVGGGSGKPPRFKVVDAVGNMVAFIGDYGDGFIGGYFQRLRVAPTYASTQRLEATASGVSLENIPLSLTGTAADVAITTSGGLEVTAKGTYAGSKLKMNSRAFVAANSANSISANLSYQNLVLYTSDGQDSVALSSGGSAGGQLAMSYSALGSIAVIADATNNRITSARGGGYISFTGASGYADMPEYRVNGSSNPVVDANRNLRWHTVYTENLVLSGLTATRWVPAYDAAGNYLGKIPIIP